ncbi:septal ring lytic transglycosylase RlpA family protein [Streptomyces sp. AC512_CC834]|uniref:septal ring lytic transglycosylase RlpA family protein n=1 Tax=Streptomyces sp. AC512_CC834 TaxID=2823691 RepID=UPI001C27D8DD|nr:septal ring lytic transglycosylase RlpA family protein [Streptomyces sp. AC512_CC834]
MSRRRSLGTKKKIALLAGAATVAGGGAFVMANASNAAQTTQNAQTKAAQDSGVCQGLATALGNNQRFIEGQRANPDAQSEARIANREAVVAEIERKQEASGCAVGESAQDSQATQPPAGGAAQAGEQVCDGSTVTLSGEGGAPAASSNQFPVGTKLKVTNLDNNKSTTVEVNSVSGSCALLNNAAFEQVREEGSFLIRRALIEKVG